MQCLAVALLLIGCWTASVHSHGYMTEPASRNYYANLQQTFWNHMSGNGGVGNIPGELGQCAPHLSSARRYAVLDILPSLCFYAQHGAVIKALEYTSFICVIFVSRVHASGSNSAGGGAAAAAAAAATAAATAADPLRNTHLFPAQAFVGVLTKCNTTIKSSCCVLHGLQAHVVITTKAWLQTSSTQ
jgi:hypothetical protein